MAHFAKVVDNIVQTVIVVEPEEIEKGFLGDPESWIQCSYNHRIRNKYPGAGDYYDAEKDIFLSPKPYPSWVLKEFIIQDIDLVNMTPFIKRKYLDWVAPVEKPEGNMWKWDESTLKWVSTE